MNDCVIMKNSTEITQSSEDSCTIKDCFKTVITQFENIVTQVKATTKGIATNNPSISEAGDPLAITCLVVNSGGSYCD